MAYKKRFDTSSAYGQLIILVFLPICVLAAVGGILVFHETMRASESEQEALAEAVLIRYKPMVTELIPALLEQERQQSKANEENSQNMVSDMAAASQAALENNIRPENLPLSQVHSDHYISARGGRLSSAILSEEALGGMPTSHSSTARVIDESLSATTDAPKGAMATLVSIRDRLSRMQSEQHVQRIAIINENDQVLATVGYGVSESWPLIDTSQNFLSQQATPIGTAYGSVLGDFEGQRLWLFVDMDNEPLYIARYRIAMALVITGLFTILILLLSLNIYAKRWIAPIYELRLQLQRTHVDNLYKPIPVESDGELNLLQQDLVKTLRRLHSSFQELKDHAEQTEDDLRLAFDEMEMQNISIRNARDDAISTSQAKSAFLANISHELRTPLNSIDGFINLLARHGELNPEQDLYVHTIRKSSAHLLALVNDVLDFSKIEAGKLVLDRHEFDLYDTIYDVVDMLSPVSAEKGLRMAVLFYNDVPMRIVGDALRLKQVLTNLVGNAIKFTDSGDVVVRVSLDDHRDNYLMISVQDSGKGISLADQKMLFQSFSQGDPSITRQYGGTGLGLVISKQLTRLMGGDIGFYDNAQENIANQGATFWFRMPTHIDVLEAATGQTIALPVLAPLASENDEFNVLVWINHNASRQVLKASLQTLPIKLTQANSLPGVLESLKEQGNYWDWVIVDNDTQDDMMALLKQIRLHYQGKLAVFGYQVAADQALLNRYHANILYEPLDKRQLYAMLDTQKKSEPIEAQAPRWHGVTVLAVDDHLPNLLVLDALLSELGIHVITANSGFDAIELISKQQTKNIKNAKPTQQSLSNKTQISKAQARAQINTASTNTASTTDMHTEEKSANSKNKAQDKAQDKDSIDLIFMDIQMPRMSGREAAQQIRKIEVGDSHIPIIALTAHGLSDERDKLLACGIDDYVGKPISQPQLLQVLQKWLGRTSTTQSLSTVTPADDINSIAPEVIDSASVSTPKSTPVDKPVPRPLSLKKIRDDYMRDIQPRDDYMREPQRVTQPRYQGLQYQDQLQESSSEQDGQSQEQSSKDNGWKSSAIDGLKVLDWEDALTRSANKPDLAAKLIIMMIDTIADEKDALAQAWQARDRNMLAQVAHRILGASRYTGVPQLRQASQDLEDKCLLNVQHTTPAQFAMLKPYHEALLLALTNLQMLDLSPYPQLTYHRLSENDMTWKMI
ncbi:ATP-binding protein [Psychrobacter sp. P2G3]|uniref:hybrid sensor histidine kinase/response regulator n=1 Tax=Psychrobacter sp. P2G3 TaxID=1699622 RepID=UPI00078DCC76|nr:ATP-binding protein [Psychrobacter sp. P2G3]AMN48857.1 histidine kinase [Psychrobacter sp. P2G3]